MFCHVYELFTKDGRRPAGGVLSEAPVYGWLAFNRPHPYGTPGAHAVLMAPKNIRFRELLRLQSAWLHRIEGGLVLKGTGVNIRRQVWVIGPTADQARAIVASLTDKITVRSAFLEAKQEADRIARDI